MFHGKEYVYEVYKEKSFSRAAQNLYISQPALSAAIKKIEARIGCCIFDRSTTPVQLTESGAEYVKAVEKIMDIENRFENHLNNLNSLKVGRLLIGANALIDGQLVVNPALSYIQDKPAIPAANSTVTGVQ